jgi:predicted nucleic acid-binding protein
MITTKFALDTNILIYSHDKEDLFKQNIARNLIVQTPVVSTQIISEYINVLRRIMPLPKKDLLNLCTQTLENCTIYPVGISTMKMAKQIIQRYDLQIFDSIIVAAAIESDCKILYSEDMQHNLDVNGLLKIINPFL